MRIRSISSSRRAIAPRRALAVVLCGASMVAFAACATPDENDTRSATAGLPDTVQALEANEWTLDGGGSSPVIESSSPVTLWFGDDGLFGDGPCNTYRAGFSVDEDDDAIEIDPIAATLRGCEEGPAAAELRYFTALESVDSVDATDRDRLVLSGSDVELVFDVGRRAGE